MSQVSETHARQRPELIAPPPATRAALTVSDGHQPADHLLHVALIGALVIGALIRGWHIMSADFPLNDGGLFYDMVRDIQAAHYRLPAFTSYNNAHIPFGYSPFTFYLAAVLNALTGVSLITIFRVLPLIASTACIGAFYLISRAMLTSRGAVAASLVAFAIVPRGFVWLLMGGGLTRSFGYFFALLALYQTWMLYTQRSLRYVPLAAVFSALTVLSHLGTAPFVAFSAALLFLFRGRHREGVIGSLLIGAGTLLLTAPWWATVIAAHGIGPFLAARATGGSIFSDMPRTGHATLGLLAQFGRRSTGEGQVAPIWILALLGIAWCVRERRALVPVWLITILLLDTRAGFTYAAAPVAMLAGLSFVHMLWPFIAPRAQDGGSDLARRAAATIIGIMIAISIVEAATRRYSLGSDTQILTALTPADRVAMEWMSQHTDTSARVLVLADGPWQIDKASEWFPVFAERRSVGTVQGSEWLERGSFNVFIQRQSQITACASADAACLESLGKDPALAFTHVYAPTGSTVACCRPLLDALQRDPRYRVIYRNEAATIFARQDSTSTASQTGA